MANTLRALCASVVQLRPRLWTLDPRLWTILLERVSKVHGDGVARVTRRDVGRLARKMTSNHAALPVAPGQKGRPQGLLKHALTHGFP